MRRFRVQWYEGNCFLAGVSKLGAMTEKTSREHLRTPPDSGYSNEEILVRSQILGNCEGKILVFAF